MFCFLDCCVRWQGDEAVIQARLITEEVPSSTLSSRVYAKLFLQFVSCVLSEGSSVEAAYVLSQFLKLGRWAGLRSAPTPTSLRHAQDHASPFNSEHLNTG